ncbi:MAG: hypothetical protein AB7G21_03530 [Dehalococcoidia bacterium]
MSTDARPGVFSRADDGVLPVDRAGIDHCDPPEEIAAGALPAAKHMAMLTNHGAALLYLHAHPDARVRDVADALHITERATARILADLKASGHLRVTHASRRNRYEVTGLLPLHPGDEAARTMADLLTRLASVTMSAFAGGVVAL